MKKSEDHRLVYDEMNITKYSDEMMLEYSSALGKQRIQNAFTKKHSKGD